MTKRPLTTRTPPISRKTIGRDLSAGLVVFLVALPLCLGIAFASGAPPFSGVVAGIIGGIVVGALSGSHTSVAGPAAGLTAVVLSQIQTLGSFDAFLLAVLLAGALQVVLGLLRTGTVAAFVPHSVITGLLAAIGVILVLKQLPHMLGHDRDPEGEMAFEQPDHENTFTELMAMTDDFHLGAAVVGLTSLMVVIAFSKSSTLRRIKIPVPVIVVGLGLGLETLFSSMGEQWRIASDHLVNVPIAAESGGLRGLINLPDLSAWTNPKVYTAALTIGLIASIESLITIQAIDKLDPRQRKSPGNRELVAQGVGNMLCGLTGGIPVTSVAIRGSVNVYYGAETRISTIFHGVLLAAVVLLLPHVINHVPLACLAAILLHTGYKLASPALMRQMLRAGPDQFVPFAATLVGIVFTDLLVGFGLGMLVAMGFILRRHALRPIRRIREKHIAADVVHIVLPAQVSFLNQRALQVALDEVPPGGHVLIDAQQSEYIDSDVVSVLREYRDVTAPARGVEVSMVGFSEKQMFENEMQFVDYSTRELQDAITPAQVLELLREGNQRFRDDRRIDRDLMRHAGATARGQHPLAVVLSCIDSRTPAELVLDQGLGDIFSIRIAGNVLSPKVLASMEFGTAVAGAKLVLVMGHTRCGAVRAAVDLANEPNPAEATGCQHINAIVHDIQRSFTPKTLREIGTLGGEAPDALVDELARSNVLQTARDIVVQSTTMARLVDEGRIAIVGALYDIATGQMEFMIDHALGLEPKAPPEPARSTA